MLCADRARRLKDDLSRMAMKGLLTKTAIDPKAIDYVCYVSHPARLRTPCSLTT
jgi:hypothetical protein